MEIKWYYILIIYIVNISLIVYLLKLFEKSTKFMYKKYEIIKDDKKCLDHLRTIHIYSNPFIYSLMILSRLSNKCSSFFKTGNGELWPV